MKFKAVKLVGKMQWFCEDCLDKNPISDPIKSRPTPHCTACGKHHPIHIGCKGETLVPPPIDYMQMFYSIRNEHMQEIGVA